MPIELTLEIKGAPASKKNNMSIIVNKRTGRPMLIQNKRYRDYEKDALKQLWQWGNIRFDGPVAMGALYWCPDRRKRDLLNLLNATADILEKAGLIQNDSQIKSVDGSRIMGVDRTNPRTEIVIRQLEEDK